MKAEPLRKRLRRSLGERWSALEAVVREAQDHGVACYLVGGPVRDLLIGVEIGDLDVLLSDAFDRVARGVAVRLGGRETLYRRFRTAHVDAGDRSLDLAGARSERYARAGALPDVRPTSVDRDFERRDFSIHAMALPLDARSGVELIDPFEGRRDLRAGELRALHDGSFRDDPTRLWRAARYAARLGFRLERRTARLARESVDEGLLDRISGARIEAELARTLVEAEPARALTRAERMGLLEAVARGWQLGPEARAGLRALGRAAARPPWPGADAVDLRAACGTRLVLVGLSGAARSRVLDRLGHTGRRRERIEADLQGLASLERALGRGASRGAVDARLDGSGEALLLLLHCTAGGEARRAVDRWARVDRKLRTPLRGHAARRLGAEGPVVGELLRAARRRHLDYGDVDERWARRWLARRQRLR